MFGSVFTQTLFDTGLYPKSQLNVLYKIVIFENYCIRFYARTSVGAEVLFSGPLYG